MKHITATLSLVAMFSLGLSAQAGMTQVGAQTGAEVKAQNPASREDVESLKKTTDKLVGAVSAVAKSAKEKDKRDEEALRKQSELALLAKAEQDKKLEDIAKTQREAAAQAEADRKATRKEISLIAGAFAIVLTIVTAIVLKTRRQSETKASTVEEINTRPAFSVVPKTRFDFRRNTNIEDVRAFVEENQTLKTLFAENSSVEIPAKNIFVKREGHLEDLEGEFDCTIVLRSDGAVVRYPELPGEEFAWKNRNVGVTKVAKKKAVA